MDDPVKVLLLGSDEFAAQVQRELEEQGLTVLAIQAHTQAELAAALTRCHPALLLIENAPPAFDGMAALSHVRVACPDAPLIFLSNTFDEDAVIGAVKAGAADYVCLGNLTRLAPAVRRALSSTGETSWHRQNNGQSVHNGNLFKLFMRHLPGAACMKDAAGRYVFVNEAWETAYHRTPAQTLGHVAEELWPAEFAAQYRANDCRVLESRKLVRAIEILPEEDGPHYWLTHKFPIFDPGGAVIRLGVMAIDVTDRVRAEEGLRRANRVLAMLSGINSAIVRIRDRDELFCEACRIVIELGQFKSAWMGLVDRHTGAVEVVAAAEEAGPNGAQTRRSLPLLVGSVLVEQALRDKKPSLWNANEHERDPALQEWTLTGGAAVILPLVVAGEAVGVIGLLAAEPDFFNDEEMKLLAELAGDVSFALDYIAKEEKLAYLAYFDALTGLPNRTLFLDRLTQHLQVLRTGERILGVIVFDIERFSCVNDTLGRHAGDALLGQVAHRLAGALKRAGQDPDNVARIGADHFAALLTQVREERDVARILEHDVLAAFSQPFTIDGEELRISVKIGVSLFPNDGGDAEILFKNAETALKRVESKSDPYLFYMPQMHARVAARLSVENRLRKALAAGEFILHYQPKMNLGSGRLAGLEALIRWNDPEYGLRLPAYFVPILEETGLIVGVGAWVLRKAAADYLCWQAKGLHPPRIAVNVSPTQLRRKDFVAELAKLLDGGESGVPGIDLEILESAVMEDVDESIAKLRAVREMGVGVAIDDFGTGYSSLAYVAKLPMNAIKIDRSFITPMASNPDDVTVVTTIISLAHSMSVKVIAEGVESDQQSYLLRLLRCDEAQGYLFSPPLPSERIEALLAAA